MYPQKICLYMLLILFMKFFLLIFWIHDSFVHSLIEPLYSAHAILMTDAKDDIISALRNPNRKDK